MTAHPILLDGHWTASTGSKTFQAINPRTRETLPDVYPVSPREELDRVLDAAAQAFSEVRSWPGSRFADFLEAYAAEVEKRSAALIEMAHHETALPVKPRLQDAELPRTINQLRQAADSARSGSWKRPIIDTKAGIRSCFGSLGPVAVFGPNNFPFAFNSIAGGDFAAAAAAGNPVIAKGHSSHPGTTRIFGEAADNAAKQTRMPSGFVQLIYRTSHEDGAYLVGHRHLAAIGYTGSREAGLVLKEAADRAGKAIYLELSSINPVFILQGALEERLEDLVSEFSSSCLMGTGQFCTNPGMVVVPAGEQGETFIRSTVTQFENSNIGTLLGPGVEKSLSQGVQILKEAGAKLLTGGEPGGGQGCSYRNTLLKVTGKEFLKNPEKLQTEAFGNCSLIVVADSPDQMAEIADALEGNLTGCIYSAKDGRDDQACELVQAALRPKVGRLLNDKMPTGVAVSAAMNHGGPFPATGHAGFTAVGIPTSISRFAMLQSYDNVRPHRLPPELQDQNPTGQMWRLIDGNWTQGDVSST